MTKNDIINETVAELSAELTQSHLDRVKITLLVKFKGYELTEINTLPSTVVYDNEYIYKRFMIDMLAKGTKPSSIKTYFNMLKPFFNSTGLNYLEVIAQDLIDYLAMMQYSPSKITGKSRSKNYISTISRTFFVFFQWAYRKHHIDTDIMRDVDRIKGQQKRKDKLTDEEVEALRDGCKTKREKALFELMLCTGMRVGEISNLDIKDIDFQNRAVEIYGIKSDKYREGILSIKAKNALIEYLDGRQIGPVFLSKRKGAERLGIGSIEDEAKRIGERVGAHCKTNVHCYRKTFASIIYQKTKDVKLVSILLGHAGTTITEKFYLIDDIEDVAYRIKKIA